MQHRLRFAINEIPSLAFDHERILRMAVKRLKERICFEPIGFELLPEVFTMTELQNLYEAILSWASSLKQSLALVELHDVHQRNIASMQKSIPS